MVIFPEQKPRHPSEIPLFRLTFGRQNGHRGQTVQNLEESHVTCVFFILSSTLNTIVLMVGLHPQADLALMVPRSLTLVHIFKVLGKGHQVKHVCRVGIPHNPTCLGGSVKSTSLVVFAA